MVTFASTTRDPFIKQNAPNINPFCSKENKLANQTVNQITKRIDKSMEQEKRKLAKEGHSLKVLLLGTATGQNYFWQGIDKLLDDNSKIAIKYQKIFLRIMISNIQQALRTLKILQLNDKLSESNEIVARQFLQEIPTYLDCEFNPNSIHDYSSIIKHMHILWGDPLISYAIKENLTFEPRRDTIL